jgi:hypothetical protein
MDAFGERAMKLGVALPLSDIGGDPATVRVFAQAAEAAGTIISRLPITFYGSMSRADLTGKRETPRAISSTILSSCSGFSAVHDKNRLLD